VVSASLGKLCFTVAQRKGALVHVVPVLHQTHVIVSGCCCPFLFRDTVPMAHPASGRTHMGLIRDRQGNYKLIGRTTEHDVLAAAEGILRGYDAASATKDGRR
jgi:hypothetical protein